MSCGAAGWTAQLVCCRRRHCRRVRAVAGCCVCASLQDSAAVAIYLHVPVDSLATPFVRSAAAMCHCLHTVRRYVSPGARQQCFCAAALYPQQAALQRLETAPALYTQGKGCRAAVVAESCAMLDSGKSTLARQMLFSVYTHSHPSYSELRVPAVNDRCCFVAWHVGRHAKLCRHHCQSTRGPFHAASS